MGSTGRHMGWLHSSGLGHTLGTLCCAAGDPGCCDSEVGCCRPLGVLPAQGWGGGKQWGSLGLLQRLSMVLTILSQPVLDLPELEGSWKVTKVLRCFRGSGMSLEFWGFMGGDTQVLEFLVMLQTFWAYC